MKRFFIIPALVLAVLASAARAERSLEHYDLDSLAYLSEAVVRVEVGDSEPFKTADGDCLVHTVKAIEVFNGSVKVGASFRVTGLDVFHRAPGMADHADSWNPIQKGDAAYLFLVPIGKAGYAKYRLTNADWTVIESGARLLEGGRVYAFGQYFPRVGLGEQVLRAPGGLVAMTNTAFPGAPVVTRQVFEASLKQSQQTVVQMNQLLAAEVTPQTGDALVKLLRARSDLLKKEMATSDALGSRLAQKTAGIVAPAELLALMADSPVGTRWQLEGILQSQAGRAYLLERVADSKETKDRRGKCARILSGAGWTYVQEVEKLETGEIKKLDTDFAAHLARLAADNVGTDLSAPLLAGVASCGRKPSAANARLAADLQAAAKVLSEVFPKAGALDQFRIAETLMQMGGESYRQLLPDAGPLLTLVEPDRDFDDALKQRALHLMCRFRNQLTIESDLKLVLSPGNGKPDVEIAIDTRIGKITKNFGSSWRITAAIPDDAVGKYRVFLRDYLGDRTNGDGLGFEIAIPGK